LLPLSAFPRCPLLSVDGVLLYLGGFILGELYSGIALRKNGEKGFDIAAAAARRRLRGWLLLGYPWLKIVYYFMISDGPSSREKLVSPPLPLPLYI
jgi:apolipoprotein N-acyltransferase